MKKDSIEIVPIGFVTRASDNVKDKMISKIVVKKLEGIYLDVNQRAADMLGYRIDE